MSARSSAEVLTQDEADRLVAELARIDALAGEGKFAIADELEDGHTAIEAHLTAALGELGGKVHTGRSRNDQVATAMRLLMRQEALEWADAIAAILGALAARICATALRPCRATRTCSPPCHRASAFGCRRLPKPCSNNCTLRVTCSYNWTVARWAPGRAMACRCHWIAATPPNCSVFLACTQSDRRAE